MKSTYILIVGLFVFSLLLRLWNFSMAGRWSDEQALEEHGYYSIQLLQKGDFNNPFWYIDASDHPPLAFYFYGLLSMKDFIRFDIHKLPSYTMRFKGAPVFQYDLPYSRSFSIILEVLSVVLVFLFGKRYFSTFVGIAAAIILAMIPHFLGYSQFVDLESWIMFFFTACVFSYVMYLETGKNRYLILTAILTGFNFEVKQSNVIIIPFYLVTFFIWKKLTRNKHITSSHFFIIGLITGITAFIVYPMPWFHIQAFIHETYNGWFKNGGLIPELIFGHRMGAHFFYYALAVMITTPTLLLLLSVFGIKVLFDNKRKWVFCALFLWFLTPFLMTFFHERQHMVRYIIQFYAPFSIIVALGLEFISKKYIKQHSFQYLAIVPIFLYLMIILISISPYYLEYYNELVGGTRTVYTHKLFFLGWFGEGLRGSGKYLENHAKKKSTIGLAINPNPTTTSIYRTNWLKYEEYNPKKQYDYVVVNYYNIIRIGFDENQLNKNYRLVYTEHADGAELAHVFQHK